MRIALIIFSSVLLFGCAKDNPAPNTPTTASEPTAPTPNEHLGLIQFDLEDESGTITHYEYYIDSIKQGGIVVDDGQGGYNLESFYVGPNIRSIAFRYFDSNGDENLIALTQTINGTTNSISLINLGANPYAAQTDTSYPLCNTADFEIDVISANEATFAADHLYNFYNEQGVNITNGSYIMY